MFLVKACGKSTDGRFNDDRYTTTVGAYIVVCDGELVKKHVTLNPYFTNPDYTEVDMVINGLKEAVKTGMRAGKVVDVTIHCTSGVVMDWLYKHTCPYRQREFDDLVRCCHSVQLGSGRGAKLSEVIALCRDYADVVYGDDAKYQELGWVPPMQERFCVPVL